MLFNAPNRPAWNVHLPFIFVMSFVGVQSTFTSADELCHKLNVFQYSDMRTDRGRLLPLSRSVTPEELIFFSSRSTLVLAQFFPGNSLNKRRGLQFFSWHKASFSAWSSSLIFLILNKTVKKIVTYYGYCHSLDGTSLFSKDDSNKLWRNVKNEITLICAKFGADLIDTSKVTSRKKVAPFVMRHPFIISKTNHYLVICCFNLRFIHWHRLYLCLLLYPETAKKKARHWKLFVQRYFLAIRKDHPL